MFPHNICFGLDHPKEVHDLREDYPLAPEIMSFSENMPSQVQNDFSVLFEIIMEARGPLVPIRSRYWAAPAEQPCELRTEPLQIDHYKNRLPRL